MFSKPSLSSLILASALASSYMPVPERSRVAPVGDRGAKAHRAERKRRMKRVKAARRANRK